MNQPFYCFDRNAVARIATTLHGTNTERDFPAADGVPSGEVVVESNDEGDGASVMGRTLEEGASVADVACKGVGGAVMAGGRVVVVGPGENVSKGYDGMGVIVGTADSVGVLVGTAGTGAEVVSCTLSHWGPVKPSGQMHPNAPSPRTTQAPPFLKKAKKVSVTSFRGPAQSSKRSIVTAVHDISTYRQTIRSFSGASGLQTAVEIGLAVGDEISVG